MNKRLLSLLALAFLAGMSPPAVAQSGGSPLQPELLHSFTGGVTDFVNNVVPGPGGEFYGVSYGGGAFGRGAFYKITPPSGTITLLASFGNPDGARGIHPVGTLVETGGFFYGVTEDGGRFGSGTIFRVSPSGTVETLVDFSEEAEPARGAFPRGGLTLGADGNLYGQCLNFDTGLIFRVSPLGRYQVLVIQTGVRGTAPGGYPNGAPMVLLPDGSLIGASFSGGAADQGVIFRVTTDGSYSVVGQFTGNTGLLPGRASFGRMAVGSDGSVYGTYRDADFNTAVWKLPPGGTVQPFASLGLDSNNQSFQVDGNGGLVAVGPDTFAFSASVVEGLGFESGLMAINSSGQILPLAAFTGFSFSGGNFVSASDSPIVPDGANGLVIFFGNKLVQKPTPGPLTTLATLQPDGGTGLGTSPAEALLVAGDGTIYGRTTRGGAGDFGTIFKRPAGGPLTTLRDADSVPYTVFFIGTDAYSVYNANPLAFHEPSGDILSVEPRGGSSGLGSVLRIDPSTGSPTTLAEFGDINSPVFPVAGLTPDELGNYYGRAALFNSQTNSDDDVVYRLTATNQIEVVANVQPLAGIGYSPAVSVLTLENSTSLLGAQPFGSNFEGVIFRVTSTGQVAKILDFAKTKGLGRNPIGPFLKEPSGSFLIPLVEGGIGSSSSHSHSSHSGMLIRKPPVGNPQIVVNFTGMDGEKPGRGPNAPLVRDASGRTYGVTVNGGRHDIGVLYRLNADNSYTKLHEFLFGDEPGNLGGILSTGLTLGADGYVYGGTFLGGAGGAGTVFRFPLTPQGSATTNGVGNLEANSATFKGVLNSNGYGGTYWFTFFEDGGSEQESIRLPLAGFTGMQNVESFVTTLKGHRDYTVRLNASLGIGADAISVLGGTQMFRTPNGTPRTADDTILVSPFADSVPGEVLDNDVDLDDDAISIVTFTQGMHGTVSIDPNDERKLVYTPSPTFLLPVLEGGGGGRDSFKYTVTDNYTGPEGALTSEATVNVLSDESISGDYAGLLVEEDPVAATGQAEAITANQIAAGFASIALGKSRKFTARFQVGAKSVSVKGSMAEGRGTRVSNTRSGFNADLRPTPGGVEGRITFNGRTLIMRTGQAFAASTGTQRPVSAFTMRFDPVAVEDPVGAAGIPAGSGFAVIRELKKSRAQLVGVLPDGTPFARGTVIDGSKVMDFFSILYKDKSGTFGGKITIDGSENIDGALGNPTFWKKSPQPRDKRFTGGFQTEMTVFGGKYTVPPKGQPPVDIGPDALIATFDRGGLFEPKSTRFTFNGAKVVIDTASDTARFKPKFNARAGTVTGTFIPVKKPVKWRALHVQRNKSVAGFFLGTADAGSVEISAAP